MDEFRKHIIRFCEYILLLIPLSSQLFSIYWIDIQAGIKSDMIMFADDVALMNKFENKNNLEFEINADLKQLNKWAYTWHMDLNPAIPELS